MTVLPLPARFALALVVAVLAVAFLGLIAPRPSHSQAPGPPAVFFGNVAEIIVNGEPYDGVTSIEAIDENGGVIDTVDLTEDGRWTLIVPAAETVRFRIGGAISAAEAFVAGGFTELVLVLSGGPVDHPTRSLELSAGFQALTHVGEELPIDDFLALFDDTDAVAGIFLWNASTQGYAVWRLGLPAALQAVTQISQNTPMLLLLESPAVYTSEVLPHDAGSWPLSDGFTSVAYLGVGGDAIDAALNAVEDRSNVTAVFRFDNAIQNWHAFNRELPLGLNSLQELQRWDFLLVRAEPPTSWPYDEFLP